ncbi:MAG TPA: molybdopterin-guanine dinucleotide biosynthesis protein B [Planctomycetes bacterium]|nr:molybdopterin-guanine dinucleotide biosynthesis protein B [Planctomycetota bacterium]
MKNDRKPPTVLSFVAPSGTGKTTLLSQVIQLLCEEGAKVAALKGTHHQIYLDKPGKDSYRFKAAGARAVGLLGPGTSTLFLEPSDGGAGDERKKVLEMVHWLSLYPFAPFDYILCEGFAHVPELPKLRVVRDEWPIAYFAERGHVADLTAIAWGKGEKPPSELPAGVALLPLDAEAVAKWLVKRREAQ